MNTATINTEAAQNEHVRALVAARALRTKGESEREIRQANSDRGFNITLAVGAFIGLALVAFLKIRAARKAAK